MASVVAKKFTRRAFKIQGFLHWLLFFLNAIAEGFAIHFDEKRSCYWVAGVVMGTFVLFVFLKDIAICRAVLNHDKNDDTKRGFYGTFNCQGLLIIGALLSCIPGIVVSSAIGAVYALNTDDENSTNTSNDTETDNKYTNIEENRTIGTFLSVISAISLIIMLRTLFLHEEIRNFLVIPKDGNSSPPPPPAQPKPQTEPRSETEPTPSSSNTQTAEQTQEEERKHLTEQRVLLKEQNRLQTEQLQLMHKANQHLYDLSAERQSGAGAMPPPPEYGSLFDSAAESRVLIPVLPSASTHN